jgi:ATP-binding cassette subfamily B protein
MLPLRPVADSDRHAERDPSIERPDGARSLEGQSVMVVDDEEEARDATHAVRSSSGAPVHLASSCAEALNGFPWRA